MDRRWAFGVVVVDRLLAEAFVDSLRQKQHSVMGSAFVVGNRDLDCGIVGGRSDSQRQSQMPVAVPADRGNRNLHWVEAACLSPTMNARKR